MDVGIKLHDLRGSGRLAMFARCVGAHNEHEAIGILADVWAETQDRELVSVTKDEFAQAVALRIEDPTKVLTAMVRSQLASNEGETFQIHGNERHVAKLQAFRANASAGGKALASKRRSSGTQAASKVTAKKVPNGMPLGTQEAPTLEPKGHAPWQSSGMPLGCPLDALDTGILDTGIKDPDLSASDFSPAISTEIDPRSSLSSDAKNSVGLTPSPSAPVVQKKVKRKERSEEQKARSLANNRRYRELYEFAEGYAPTGLDQSFNSMMAKFSDKYGDDARAILEWAFSTPDRSFGNKGWRLDYIFDQAPRLWREINNPRAAVEHLAAPRQQHQVALAASNDLAFDEYQRRKAERLANAKPV